MALSQIARRILANFMMTGPEAKEICDAIDANTAGTNPTVSGTQTYANNANQVFNATNGTMHGTNANQKQSFYGATPVTQPNGVGELLGLNGNAATAANATNMNSNGNLGSRYYNYNDLIKDLKTLGVLATN